MWASGESCSSHWLYAAAGGGWLVGCSDGWQVASPKCVCVTVRKCLCAEGVKFTLEIILRGVKMCSTCQRLCMNVNKGV